MTAFRSIVGPSDWGPILVNSVTLTTFWNAPSSLPDGRRPWKKLSQVARSVLASVNLAILPSGPSISAWQLMHLALYIAFPWSAAAWSIGGKAAGHLGGLSVLTQSSISRSSRIRTVER